MSSNREIARAYLEDAEYSFMEALAAFNKGRYHRAIRRMQEAVELSLKALLRYLGIEYPKAHDVSMALYKFKDVLPDVLREKLDFISKVSLDLALNRAPAFYGDEERMIPPKLLYDKSYAEEKLKQVNEILTLIKSLIK